MDMIFKRYSCPFDFIETHIKMGSFSEAIKNMADEINEERLWEMYLKNPFNDKPFKEWKEIVLKQETRELSRKEVMIQVNKANDILNSFKLGVNR